MAEHFDKEKQQKQKHINIGKKPVVQSPKEGADYKGIVRIFSADIKGNYNLLYGLSLIKGIKYRTADFVCLKSGIDPTKKIGNLTDKDIEQVELTIRSLKDSLPKWMKNRQKDPETGKDNHLVTSDLTITQDNDIKLMKKIKCYKGVRHMHGQPVRGQRTRSHFRKNKKKLRRKSK